MLESVAPYYDAVIDWEKRLGREMPLLEEIARRAGPRVLLPACGTGGHVVSLAERGFKVLGFDAEESALEIVRHKISARASSIATAGGKAQAIQLTMEGAHTLGPVYDVAFCLGNALPGLSEPGQLLAALRGVAGALRPGGVFLTQNLNYDLRWREKSRWFPVLPGETRDEEVLLVKFADYEAACINFHAMFLSRCKKGGKWQTQVKTSRQVPLLTDLLLDLLRQSGFEEFHLLGDFAKSPFDAEKSHDLIVAAEKGKSV